MVKDRCVFESTDTFLLLSAKQLLISNGISCFIPDEQFSSLYIQSPEISAKHGIYVNESEEAAALELIQGYISPGGEDKNVLHEDISPEDIITENGIHCPNCFSERFYTEMVSNDSLWSLFKRLIGRDVAEEKLFFICQICGYSWPSENDSCSRESIT